MKGKIIKQNNTNSHSQEKTVSENDNLINDVNNKLLIGNFDQSPLYKRKNEYIKYGYLLNCNTVKKTLKSLFMIHNETVNIWSHLLGAILFIFLIWYTLFYITNCNTQINIIKLKFLDLENLFKYSSYKDNNILIQILNLIKELKNDFYNKIPYKFLFKEISFIYSSVINLYFEKINLISIRSKLFLDILLNYLLSLKTQIFDLLKIETKEKYLPTWPIYIFLISAIACFIFSASYHSFGHISFKCHYILNRFDYSGISLLITGSCYPPYYYFFYYDKNCKIFYLSFISIFGLFTFFMSFTSNYNSPKKRAMRGILYIIFGICAGIPIIHMSFFGEYIKGYVLGIRLLFWYLGGGSYIIGAILYILRFPEKKFPGLFDYFGSSHQIFHVLVFAGATFHFIGCLDSYYYRFNNLEF